MAKRIFDGTLVELGEGDAATVLYAADTWATVGALREVSGGGRSRGTTEFRDVGATTTSYIPHLAESFDTMTMTLEQIDDPIVAELIEAYNARQKRHIRFTFPVDPVDGGLVRWRVVSIIGIGEPSYSVQGELTIEVTMQPHTAPTDIVTPIVV